MNHTLKHDDKDLILHFPEVDWPNDKGYWYLGVKKWMSYDINLVPLPDICEIYK